MGKRIEQVLEIKDKVYRELRVKIDMYTAGAILCREAFRIPYFIDDHGILRDTPPSHSLPI